MFLIGGVISGMMNYCTGGLQVLKTTFELFNLLNNVSKCIFLFISGRLLFSYQLSDFLLTRSGMVFRVFPCLY